MILKIIKIYVKKKRVKEELKGGDGNIFKFFSVSFLAKRTKKIGENEKILIKSEFRRKKIICPLCWNFSFLPKWPLLLMKTNKQESNGQRGVPRKQRIFSLHSVLPL